jgi:diguanylate cyclase (GGDEF)-like protein
MELRAYLRTLASKWWIVLLTFLITYGATLAFTFTQTPVYQSRATYVLTLGPAFRNNKDTAGTLEVLSRRTEIATTYSTLAASRLIKKQAADDLGLSEEQRADLAVSSQLVVGTNVLEVSATGSNPVLLRDFTNKVGDKLVNYVQTLYETYQLELLDRATIPDIAIRPNKPLNLALGAIMGLVLGAGLAFLVAYLQAPSENVTNFGVLDDETGVYNKRYFTLRLRQEMSRTKRNSRPLSVALLNVDHRGVMDQSSPPIRREALRNVAMLLERSLRNEDIMARFGDTVFALLLPDLSGDAAKVMVERMQRTLAGTPLELERSGVKLDLHGAAGVTAYPRENLDKDTSPDTLLTEATRALKHAETGTYGEVYLYSEDGTQRDNPGIISVPSVQGPST